MYDNDSTDYLIIREGAIDTTINDPCILKQIQIELGRCEYIDKEEYDIDARMKCYIKYTNGQTDTLCMDRWPTSFSNLFNNRPIKLTNKLVYLIRKNCNYYKWMDIRLIQYFDELNDTTFVREKVNSYFGQEY